ncbi:hypothetical protein ACIODW_14415 [Streptomyces sp. NPDC087897]|uniref:hypothetical protein n=1 Tax=Streptomyces sp. NPDC087897 TaxID=3365817 RepID=UPI0038153C8F
MPDERPEAAAPPARFDTSWCATDLGAYRPCRFTYAYYPYESLPPLDSAQYTGAFAWLGGLTEPAPDRLAALDRLAAALAAEGVALPRDFVTCLADAKLRFSLDDVSVTGCWTDVSEPLPSPVEPGAFLVRFLRDQQDCVHWYLHLRPSGEVFVVHSSVDYADLYEAEEGDDGAWPGLADPEDQEDTILWCAPSFEEFAHRFWIENRLWRALQDGDLSALSPQEHAYLRHYAPSGTPT